ncbi:MAG: ribonuclease III [Victivallaceae bacterium]|nr:ribonuclease III [Victivallaceae bacterium]
MAADIAQFKNTVGYEFKNRDLLKEALTHRSYASETQLSYDNQRLEFLGDAVVEIILSEYIFSLLPRSREGVMTKLRSALAQEPALAAMARALSLGDFLLMGRGERDSGGAERDSILCDLFEAVTGAIYLDGGIDPARRFVLSAVGLTFPEPLKLLTMLNPKGTLQEYAQHRWGTQPEYAIVEKHGPDHLTTFVCEASIGGYRATGTGSGRRPAESDAARRIIEIIAGEDPSINEFY